MDHHDADSHPIPREKAPLFINEPSLTDKFLYRWVDRTREPEKEEDNIRVYIPMDLNKEAILRRLRLVIDINGPSSEENEANYTTDVDMLIDQIAIYDQIWYNRTMAESDKVSTRHHSIKGIALVREFIDLLEDIPDHCAELFPYQTIDELKKEYEI